MRQTGGKTTTAMLKFGPLSPNCRQRAMETVSPDDITRWLRAWSRGDGSALEKLTPLVYAELRQRARRLTARERIGHSLQPTALIHEAYLRLVGAAPVDWRDRRHFYALSARLMRQILVDHARSRGRHKRGGAALPIAFDETVMGPRKTPDLVRLDDALHALADTDARKSRVIELRFFGGLSVDETADILEVSPQTVLRDWRLAKAWLQREMKRGDRVRR
jgi:RNA polymerase sigma factor (TIGR02999 family)